MQKKLRTERGENIHLDPDGKYYPIDYDKLQKYVQRPKDEIHYILQNPVGEVFYLDKLTPLGEEEFVDEPSKDDDDVVYDYEESEIPSTRIWHGAPYQAFDFDDTSTVNAKNLKITWDGDLTNKAVYLNIRANYYNGLKIYIKDEECNNLQFINNTNDFVNYINLPSNKAYKGYFVIPEGAKSINIISNSSSNYSFTLYDLNEKEDLDAPGKVTNVGYEPKSTSVLLTWTNPVDEDFKEVVVYRSNTTTPTKYTKLGTSTTGSFEDKTGLYVDTKYIYTLIAKDINNNISIEDTNINTLNGQIIWHGADAPAFDFNDETIVTAKDLNITWDGNLVNKGVYLNIKANYYNGLKINVKDVNGNLLQFLNNDGEFVTTLSISSNSTYKGYITIPEGAKSITIVSSSSSYNFTLYDIHEN